MTYMGAWVGLKFGQIAGNDDMHESSEEFEFLPNPTTDCGVSCH